MSNWRAEDAIPLTILQEAFGGQVELSDGIGDSEPMVVLAEFGLNGRQYAVLQSAPMKSTDEVALFYITADEQGELSLETVEDDDEWETVLEVYDEMTVSFD